MALHSDLITLIGGANIVVSEWLLQSGQVAIKPPYAVVCGTGTEPVYANGKIVFEYEQVSVHFVYRLTEADKAILTRLDELLKPYGYNSKTEQASADKVMIKTYDLEG